MDCIRIYQKLEELKEKPDDSHTLWSPFHLCTINVKEMTVVLDNKPGQTLSLVRGKTYERPREEGNLRADASNCNLKGKWPK